MKLTLTNPSHAEKKSVKIGWSWTCFFFAGFFGVPLFLRGLNRLGGVCAILGVMSVFANAVTKEALKDGDQDGIVFWSSFGLLLSFVMVILSIYLGIKGNKLTGIALLNKGWIPEDTQGEAFLIAKEKWVLSELHNKNFGAVKTVSGY